MGLLAGLGVGGAPREAAPAVRGRLVLRREGRREGDAALAGWSGAKVVPRALPRTEVHAYGRAGDLVLQGSEGTSLTVAATEDSPGHRPLQGALVDVDVDGTEGADPLLWLKVGWRDGGGRVHVPDVADVETTACGSGSEGVSIQAVSDGVMLRTEVCALAGGRYRLKTLAAGLAPDASIVDELHPGTALPAIEGQGFDWDGEHPTRFVTFAEHGVAFAYEASAGTRAVRNRVRIATEVFPTALHVVHANGAAQRTLSLARGDALDAIALLRASTRSFSAGFEDGAAGTVTVVGGDGRPFAFGAVPAGRAARAPAPGFGEACELRDEAGVPAGERIPIPRRGRGRAGASRGRRALAGVRRRRGPPAGGARDGARAGRDARSAVRARRPRLRRGRVSLSPGRSRRSPPRAGSLLRPRHPRARPLAGPRERRRGGRRRAARDGDLARRGRHLGVGGGRLPPARGPQPRLHGDARGAAGDARQ